MSEASPKPRPAFVCISCNKKINLKEEKYLVEKKLNTALNRFERTGRYIHETCDRKDHQGGIWHKPEGPKPSTVY